MTSQNDKRFRNPAWIILLLGFGCDFTLALLSKQQTITINNYATVPAYTLSGIVIFLILNFIPQIKKYFESKSK
jgi:hypothetical protein